MTPSIIRTRRTLISFTVILVVFLIVADSIIITQQINLHRTEMTTHAENEFNLFGKLIAGSLTKGDYTAAEEVVTRWGEDQDNILSLNVSTVSGFTIASYKQEKLVSQSKRFHGKIEYGINNVATITMVKDITGIYSETTGLAYQLIAFSTILVALLGFLLQRTAVQPLQKEIREHERTEEKLQRRADELRTINKELESFNYSLSHDLRSPLRSIVGFSQILQKDAGTKLNAEEKEYFERIIAASKHMAEIIDDMLELGRVTRGELEHVDVDFTALANKTALQLGNSCRNRAVNWKIEPGLSAVGDKKLFALLLDNLLGNAWKYTNKSEDASIEFGMTHFDGRTAYFVKDNGVGFDMQYADKLFKPFHRLHNNEVFEGTGIGLATVQRIIHRHGGRIWAEAKEDKGATFYFTLPKA